MHFFTLFYKLTIYLQEESIIAMHRTMQRSLDNMLLMATELCCVMTPTFYFLFLTLFLAIYDS
jgi:hypothetical protein